MERKGLYRAERRENSLEKGRLESNWRDLAKVEVSPLI
jgi:hypothetical protein